MEDRGTLIVATDQQRIGVIQKAIHENVKWNQRNI
jgi:hypothetical protein